MKKIILLGLILGLILLVGCKAGGKAIATVPGDAVAQANSYLDNAEESINNEDMETASVYLVYAESAISKIPYEDMETRNALKARYDALKAKLG